VTDDACAANPNELTSRTSAMALVIFFNMFASCR